MRPALLLAVAGCGGDSSDAVVPSGGGISIVSGGTGSDTIGVQLATLVVLVRGPRGAPAPGVDVRVEAHPSIEPTYGPIYLSGNFTPGTRNLVTDDAGRVSVRVFASAPTGRGEVMISVPSLGTTATAGPYESKPGKPVKLAITPADTPVYVGASYRVSARTVDRLGDSVSGGARFETQSSTIEIGADGTVRGLAEGRGRFSASIGSFTATADVSVVPRATIAMFDMGVFVGDTVSFGQAGLDGSGVQRIAVVGLTPNSHGVGNLRQPRWIPGSGRVVYPMVEGDATRLFGDPTRLYVGDSTRAARRLVATPSALTSEYEPEPSADGAWVYFIGVDSTARAGIWRVPAAGGAPQRIDVPSVDVVQALALAPDGTKLAFAGMRAYERLNLYVHDLRTGVTSKISTKEVATPRWSPTGEWILYTVGYPGFAGEYRLIHSDGTGDRVLTTSTFASGGAWSPDGRYVLGLRIEYVTIQPTLIDVASGAQLPLVYRKTWYSFDWRR